MADLDRQLAAALRDGGVEARRHGHAVIVWSTSSPWVDVHDDGDTLVVVDGTLHGGAPPGRPAAAMARLYRTHGRAFCAGVLGDYVVAVLDRPSPSLLVARDPVGVRPWYTAGSGSDLLGASDLATLANAAWVDTTPNTAALIEYLAAVPQSRGPTLYRGIATLPPGCTWRVEHDFADVQRHHRWAVALDGVAEWGDALAMTRNLLDEAIDSRTSAGTSATTSELSGGLDSSCVTGTLHQRGHDDLVAARLVFPAGPADEKAYSDAAAAHWGIPLVSANPWMPSEDVFLELTRHLRRPPPDPNFTMFISLHRLLSGMGRGDSLTGLGGDDAFVPMPVGALVVSSVRRRGRGLMRGLRSYSDATRQTPWAGVVRPTLAHLAGRRGRPPAWMSRRAVEEAGLTELFAAKPVSVTGIAAVDERLAGLSSGYIAHVLEDRAVVTDLVGRRETHPFLDPRLVQGLYGLNPWWSVEGGRSRALQVAAFADRLPPVVARRQSKAEFSAVVWPQMLHRRDLDRVRRGPLRELGWLDDAGFAAVVDAAGEGKAAAALPLSRCVSLDRWLRLV